jgi:hypothetical protein
MTKTPDCLIGAGVLGHTWVTTRSNVGGTEAYESIYCQASSGADAARAFDELPLSQRGHIYKRNGRQNSKWKRVTRAFALLDQPTDGRKPYEPAIDDDDIGARVAARLNELKDPAKSV